MQSFKRQSGFTLIELMITVAIIGVIAAIAIPQYESYILQTQTIRVVSEIKHLRTEVERCLYKGLLDLGVADTECNPNVTASRLIQGNSQMGVPLPQGIGVAQITNPLTPTTTIDATIANDLSVALRGKRIVWERANLGGWTCRSNVDEKYLSGSCNYDASL